MQVGMLNALAEQGVAPDLVAGTSVGALNGAVVAIDPTTAAGCRAPGRTFEELALPFAAITLDTTTGCALPIRRGPLLPALLASTAIPGSYRPVDPRRAAPVRRRGGRERPDAHRG